MAQGYASTFVRLVRTCVAPFLIYSSLQSVQIRLVDGIVTLAMESSLLSDTHGEVQNTHADLERSGENAIYEVAGVRTHLV